LKRVNIMNLKGMKTTHKGEVVTYKFGEFGRRSFGSVEFVE
jgi:hypothetical protein